MGYRIYLLTTLPIFLSHSAQDGKVDTFFKIKRRFGWGVAVINLLLDIHICVVAGLFGFTITTIYGLLLLFLLGTFDEENIEGVLFGTSSASVLFFCFGFLF
jgi:hypothetical protein